MRTGIIFFLSLFTAFAQGGISGNYFFTFTNYPIWDLTGEYVRTIDSTTLSLDISHSPNGKITGSRHEVYSKGQDYYEGQGSAQGVVTSGSAGTVARATSRSSYRGVLNGVPFSASAVSNDRLLVLPATLSLWGDSKLRLCVQGGRCTTAQDTYEVPLADNMTGHWTLQLTLSTAGKTVSGTAKITLSNGKVLDCSAKGRFDARHGSATMTLLGVSASAGTRLSFVLPSNGYAPSRFLGSVMGQKVDLRNRVKILNQWPR